MAGFAAFPGYMRKAADPVWAEPVRLALYWYVESNGDAGGVEGSIILTQAAFELLAHVLLVEVLKEIKADPFRKMEASKKIGRLLTHCGIPLEIPPSLAALRSWATDKDGPQAFTEIRNGLVHANPKKLEKLNQVSLDGRRDAWQLGLWYLELVLLRLFDYTGTYANRLNPPDYRPPPVERVPWA